MITINNMKRQVLGSEPLRRANINSVSEKFKLMIVVSEVKEAFMK